MFIGHFGIGLIGKSVSPKTSLGTWFLSVQFLDFLWPVLLLTGWEHVRIDPGNTKFTPFDFYDYPISHSLLTVMGWSILFGILYYLLKKNKRIAFLLGLGVLSHWFLDLLVHRPDLPLNPGETVYAGLGLWNYPILTILLEIPIYLVGILFYFRSTSAKDKTGEYGLWILLILLFALYFTNFGPLPPNEMAIAWSALILWVTVPWAYWVDRHRISKNG